MARRRLPKELKEGEAHVPWQAIAGIGGVLRHDYHETYPSILWETCQKDLKTLKEAVGRIARQVSTVPHGKSKSA